MKPEWKFRGELNGISEEVQSILTGRGATWDIKKGIKRKNPEENQQGI